MLEQLVLALAFAGWFFIWRSDDLPLLGKFRKDLEKKWTIETAAQEISWLESKLFYISNCPFCQTGWALIYWQFLIKWDYSIYSVKLILGTSFLTLILWQAHKAAKVFYGRYSKV